MCAAHWIKNHNFYLMQTWLCCFVMVFINTIKMLFCLQYGPSRYSWKIKEEQGSIHPSHPRCQIFARSTESTKISVRCPSWQPICVCQITCPDPPNWYTRFGLGEEGVYQSEIPQANNCNINEEIHRHRHTGAVSMGSTMPMLKSYATRKNENRAKTVEALVCDILICWKCLGSCRNFYTKY